MEIWKAIKDYEDLYEISNMGRLRSKDKIRRLGKGKGYDRFFPSKILSTSINNCGYEICILNKPNSKVICKSIHRLVAETFIPNPLNLTDINHKDENKLNNKVDNLEWISHKDNINYGSSNIKRSESWKNKSENELLASKFARGWYPQLFRQKKRYAVIYKGVRYNSREEWSECIGLTRARLTQLVNDGKAEIEIYYTIELNK